MRLEIFGFAQVRCLPMLSFCDLAVVVLYNSSRSKSNVSIIVLLLSVYAVRCIVLTKFKPVIYFSLPQRLGLHYWATVCKTVRPMLSHHCLSVCLSVLSATLVYCGQTVGRLKMKLGMQVGLGPGHIVLGKDPAPAPQRGTAPNFRPISVSAKWLHGSRCHLVWS